MSIQIRVISWQQCKGKMQESCGAAVGICAAEASECIQAWDPLQLKSFRSLPAWSCHLSASSSSLCWTIRASHLPRELCVDSTPCFLNMAPCLHFLAEYANFCWLRSVFHLSHSASLVHSEFCLDGGLTRQDPSTQDAEARGSEFKASLGLYPKINKQIPSVQR